MPRQTSQAGHCVLVGAAAPGKPACEGCAMICTAFCCKSQRTESAADASQQVQRCPHLEHARDKHIVLEGVGKALRVLVELVQHIVLGLPHTLPLVHWLWNHLQSTQLANIRLLQQQMTGSLIPEGHEYCSQHFSLSGLSRICASLRGLLQSLCSTAYWNTFTTTQPPAAALRLVASCRSAPDASAVHRLSPQLPIPKAAMPTLL